MNISHFINQLIDGKKCPQDNNGRIVVDVYATKGHIYVPTWTYKNSDQKTHITKISKVSLASITVHLLPLPIEARVPEEHLEIIYYTLDHIKLRQSQNNITHLKTNAAKINYEYL